MFTSPSDYIATPSGGDGRRSERLSMNIVSRLFVLGAHLLLTVALSAQPTGHSTRGPGGHGRGNPIIRVLDNDQDGVISAEEIANAPSNLKSLDVNGDSKITVDDCKLLPRPAGAPMPPADRPAPPADTDHPRPLNPIMLALDANQDGELSAAEIANATTSLKALDLNKDGKLTPDEYRPLPPEGAPAEGAGRHFGRPPSGG